MPLLLACVLVTTILVYLPGLPGFFVYDDLPNLVRHTAFQFPVESWQDFARIVREGLSSPLGRPVSLLSFAVNHALAGGFDPLSLKLTNIAIHLVNGLLLYFLVRDWARRCCGDSGHGRADQVALVCVAIWLLHPLNLTSVLYVVQRMNSLSAFFVLCGLLAYAHARRLHDAGRSGWLPLLLALLVAWPAATLAKENGILMVLYALVVEVTLMNRESSRAFRREILTFHALGLLPFAAAAVYLLIDPGFVTNGYSAREFGLGERLWTESRVLWIYLGLILLPDPRRMSLYHDDIAISSGWLAPSTTLLSVAGLVALIVLALLMRRRWPLLLFAVAWYLLGHLLESSFIALRIAQEQRNYLPQVGVLFPVAVALAGWSSSPHWRRLTLISLVIVLALATAGRAYTWGEFGRFVAFDREHHPRSVTAYTNSIKWHVDQASRDPEHAVELLDSALEDLDSLGALGDVTGPLPGLYRVIIQGRLARLGRRSGEPEGVQALAETLTMSRLTPLELNLLGYAVSCTIGGACILEPDLLDRLLSSALENRRNGGRIRAYLHGARADVHFVLRRDLDGALEEISSAARHDPSISSYTVRWIELLILSGQFEVAQKTLESEGRRLDSGLRNALQREIERRMRSSR